MVASLKQRETFRDLGRGVHEMMRASPVPQIGEHREDAPMVVRTGR